MWKRFGLLLLLLNFVRKSENVNSSEIIDSQVKEYNKRFSWWPSVHNAARLVKVRRQAAQASPDKLQTEGGPEELNAKSSLLSASSSPVGDNKNLTNDIKQQSSSVTSSSVAVNITSTTVEPVVNHTETKINSSTIEKPKELDLNNPGVLKRGFIVFGGFALLALAYFIFYRRKGNKNDSNNTHNTNDANQFRYGVLQSEDRRDNLELSRIPLTMESDDEEDEDLEIFDLEQKKKSLSYVNLQTNDEDVVFSNRENNENDKDNLLLDIEDGTSETLINWSSNGSKSIL